MSNIAEIVVGVPVHNGAEYLQRCLQCLKDQTFKDFKVVIFENASTDNSLEIAESFVNADKRFSVQASETLLDVNQNFERAVHYCSTHGRYFCLRAGDDYTSDDYLEALHSALESRPGSRLAGPAIELVFQDGTSEQRLPHPLLENPEEFITSCRNVWKPKWSPGTWYYGLYKGEISGERLNGAASLLPTLWSVDNLVVMQFLLAGELVYAPQATFYYRIGAPSDSKYILKTFRGRAQARWQYFTTLRKFGHRFNKGSLVARFKFNYTCWLLAKYHTGYTGKRLLFGKSQLRNLMHNRLISLPFVGIS